MFDSVILLALSTANVLLWLWVRRLRGAVAKDDARFRTGNSLDDSARRRVLDVAVGLAPLLLLVQLGIVMFGGVGGNAPGITVTSIGYVLPYFLNMVNGTVAMLAVVGVVLLGAYLSLQQFRLWIDGQRSLLKMSVELTESVSEEMRRERTYQLRQLLASYNSTIEMSAKSLKVVTPFVGVLVLVISLAFLYVVLKYANITALH